MSKPPSGLFSGTAGDIAFYGNAESVIASRVTGLDLSEHPIGRAQLSNTAKKAIVEKVKARTATKEEYERLQWDRRFTNRRKAGVKLFWKQERKRLLRGEKETRKWTAEQRKAIVEKRPVVFNGSSLQGHHTYSASLYPHLANKGEIIYPATKYEHLKGWHGGSYKKSAPGKRIRKIQEF